MKTDPFIQTWVSEVGHPPESDQAMEFEIAKKWFDLGLAHNEELRAQIEELQGLLDRILG